jgi:hypothetical protein
MADGSSRLDAGGVSETVASDDIGGQKYQRVKLNIGADGAAVDVQPPADAQASSTIVPSGTLIYNAAGAVWNVQRVAVDSMPLNSQAGLSPVLFNETTYDRQRGNTQGTLLASAARTVQTTTALQTNYNARGVVLGVRVSAKAAATTLTIDGSSNDPISGTASFFFTHSGFAAAANSTLYLVVYPGVINADLTTTGFQTTNKGFSIPLPRTWAVTVSPSDANSVTYSLSYSLIV